PKNDPCGNGNFCEPSDGGYQCASGCKSDQECPNMGCCNHACVDTKADPLHCGMCNTACGGISTCCAGVCVDTGQNPVHCGGCGKACPKAPNASIACAQSACKVIGCTAPFSDCNLDPADGCEADLTADPGNCLMCGAACLAANGEGGCMNGCIVKSCYAGFGDCNKMVADGCETLTTQDAQNCGACGMVCQPPPNATSGCAGGKCAVGGCLNGFGECNNDPMDGCETTLASDAMHCGKCGNGCAFPNAVAGCVNGACAIAACKAPFSNCNKNALDGCEIDTAKDLLNCGACSMKCPVPANATAKCANGVCGLGVCNADFGNCDGNAANGCEASLLTDLKHCGMCGKACPINSPSCKAGVCVTLYTFTGIAQNLPQASLTGWTECHKETFASTANAITTVLQKCNKANLLIACRQLNSATLTLAAHAPRADVTFVNAGNTPRNANGVGWYYATSRSWGFAKLNDPLSLSNCDTNQTNPTFRMCWHTGSGNITSGYRCGANTLIGNPSWERLVFHAD
ncbi:MAG: hypothetical protein EXR72_24780, partial [Myxococcales bacterium]|nr:hypothetical protein [Myxococcales bacterium]